MTAIFDPTPCTLGEGPLWHPERQALIWFDILSHQMFLRDADGGRQWDMGEYASAAGWVDHDTLLVATQTGLDRFDLITGARSRITALEADQPETRSNDGRADPMGGFWIGTMGVSAQPGAGAIYRYYRGELRKLFAPITISNAICFAPDGRTAYFADTTEQAIRRVALDAEGWPEAEPMIHIDLSAEDVNPDGAVTDAEGRMWNAQWGASRVACYGTDGGLVQVVDLPTAQITCPAFGGPDLRTLLVTSAAEGQTDAAAGQTFSVPLTCAGRPEPRVIL
ncbi:MAG: SMP-30/gluconolactonase/LRE family protein [Paracoccaceae bacterium]